jgi:hypothetical protein
VAHHVFRHLVEGLLGLGVAHAPGVRLSAAIAEERQHGPGHDGAEPGVELLLRLKDEVGKDVALEEPQQQGRCQVVGVGVLKAARQAAALDPRLVLGGELPEGSALLGLARNS